ncbi:MAG TPA: CRTAC1 family protein [Nannocystaceae bacterium]|nr:CRTAC1 family protein [Nannocystaceae bacterium]
MSTAHARWAALVVVAACGDAPASIAGGSSSSSTGAITTAAQSEGPGGSGASTSTSDSGGGGSSSSSTGAAIAESSSSGDGNPTPMDLAAPDVAVAIVPPYERVDLDIDHDVLFGLYGPGQGWADMNGDGWLDLLTVGGAAACELWENDAGTLDHSPLEADLATVLDTAGVTLADYDNDGDPDVYLLRLGPNVLLRNDDGVALVDVSAEAGVDYDGHPSSASWGDYDEDGYLDLYLCAMGSEPDRLYHNEGDGTFTERSDLLVGQQGVQAFAASFSDFDDDGDVDIYVVNDKQAGNRMWRNDGPGCAGWCFTEVGALWGAAAVVDGMGLAVGDYDNDLDLDLSFSDTDTHNVLCMSGNAPPVYEDVSAAMGVVFDAHGWGTLFFDYDNDGFLDLYVADSQLPLAQTRMFHNLGGTGFADVSAECDCVDAGWNYGVSSADYDEDGGVDFIVGQRSLGHALYRNTAATGHHWLEIELEGGGPINRDAVGTKVIVETVGGTQLRRDVEIGTGIASQSSLRLHFGLGDDDLDAIEITWPDGTVEYPALPPVDTLYQHAYPL